MHPLNPASSEPLLTRDGTRRAALTLPLRARATLPGMPRIDRERGVPKDVSRTRNSDLL
jgi:hypothetical protein